MANNAVWIVVEVRSGIPVEVKAFSSHKLAYEYSESLRKDLDLNDDETGIFQLEIESALSN